MSAYKQVFTLRDIFTDKALAGKLPIMSYKEITKDSGTKINTNVKTVKRQVFDMATKTARPYYTDFKAVRSENLLELSGNLTTDINSCKDAIYNALMSIKDSLSYTANDMLMIREAIKESESKRMATGSDTKLYLRVSSKQEILNMNKKQLDRFMQDIMENIYYGDYWQVQEKYKVYDMKGFSKSYDERANEWLRKVGAD